MAADRAEESGLAVCEPSPQLKEKLAQFLPSYCSLRNPFDLTVEGTEEGYRETLCAVLEEYDAALALEVSTPFLDSVALARGVCDAAAESRKPIAANFMAGRIVAGGVAYLKAHDIPNYPIGERAVAVLARMADYEAFKTNWRTWPVLPKTDQRVLCGKEMLEPDAMQWLSENGIPTPPFRFATNVSEAVAACRDIGYPAVMKVVSPDILHKTERRGVILNIVDDEAAAAAFTSIRKSVAEKLPIGPTPENVPDFRGVVIYPSVQEALEVLLGLSHDPQFGPVVVIGLGGIYTEALRDISLGLAPVDHTQAQAMIRDLRCFPLLAGVRGQLPRDLEALADVLVTFSRLPFIYPDVAEIDLNPVFLLPKGLLVGDVRVICKEQTER